MKNYLLVFLIFLISLSIFPINTQAQWTETSIPYGAYGSFAIKDSNLFVGAWHGGVFRTTDNGDTWIDVSTGLTNHFTGIIAAIGNNLVAGTQTGDVFVSTNDGTTWVKSDSFQVNSLASNGTKIFAGTYNGNGVGVRISSDGFSWTDTDTIGACYEVRPTAVKGSLVFAGSYGCGLFRSNNDGASWMNLPACPMTIVSALFVHGDDIYCADGTHVVRSSDDGTTWTEADSGLSGINLYAFASSGNNIFAGTWGGGVFLSTNRGVNWTSVNQGLGESYIAGLGVTGLYLFASNGVVYRRLLSEMITSVQQDNSTVPQKYSLEQNYPNPFNPSTTISYQLPTQNYVTLKVFDVLGREVTMLVNRVEEPGYKSVNFDASRLSSGMYYYRLQAGSFVETKKLLLLR